MDLFRTAPLQARVRGCCHIRTVPQLKLIGEKNVQFRAEGFNIFNHTNFATIAVGQTTPGTFGTVTAARDNRILQVAMKFNY